VTVTLSHHLSVSHSVKPSVSVYYSVRPSVTLSDRLLVSVSLSDRLSVSVTLSVSVYCSSVNVVLSVIQQSKKLMVGTSVETSLCPPNPGIYRGRASLGIFISWCGY